MTVTLIADDLTGACDAGALFAGHGPVSVVLDAAAADRTRPVIAIDTESRGWPADEARRRVRDAGAEVRARLTSGIVFKKIDSTLRGPIGAEIDAVRETSGRRTAVVCSAFPAEGRTVVDGCLRVHGTPAAASPIAADPAYPAGTSSVVEILRRGTGDPVRHVPLACVRSGAAGLADALARAADGLIAVDAETDADLDRLAAALIPAGAPSIDGVGTSRRRGSASPEGGPPARRPALGALADRSARIGAASAAPGGQAFASGPLDPATGERAGCPEASDVVLAGSAGLARAVALRLGLLGARVPLPAGRRWLVVAGSLHPTTRAQIAELAPHLASAVVDGPAEPDVRAIVSSLRDGGAALLSTSPAPTAAARPQIAAALADVAARVLATARPDLVIATGGDTAHALIRALGADRIELIGAPASGLALAAIEVGGVPLPLVTKAGGFGAPDLLVTLLRSSAQSGGTV